MAIVQQQVLPSRGGVVLLFVASGVQFERQAEGVEAKNYAVRKPKASILARSSLLPLHTPAHGAATTHAQRMHNVSHVALTESACVEHLTRMAQATRYMLLMHDPMEDPNRT